MSAATTRTPAPPAGVREIETERIAMPDGVRLALQLWLPDAAERVPVVLEAIPYRKRDSTRAYSRYWGRQLARRGIGYARLDTRGSGDSEGLLRDEYLPQEQDDAAHAIAWLAAQPWCNGNVGMRGVSWGGFATLQTAALAPPALKAIMPMCASDRRYTDDAHYVGGAFALTGLKWATSFKLVMAGPPDPEVFGAGWERAWRERLEASPAIAARWLGHQREDAYWRQGSVGVDYGRIRCPVYLVGGWADPYNEAIPRLLAGLKVPAKALIGPWGHGYPAPAAPGPGLQWAFEEARWWRHWLAGEETGIMQDPQVWAYLPESSPVEAAPGPIPGRWIAEPAWPPRTEPLTLRLGRGRLSAEPGEAAVIETPAGGVVGLQTPEWVPFAPPQYAQEQSPDDALSLTFDGDRLEAPLELLGTPRARLRLAASAPVAKLAVRLTEVAPDGRAWPISYGVLNLTHLAGHDAPEPLAPGAFHDVDLPLYLTARRLPAGARLRLAVSEGLWPLVWPSPAPVTLKLDLAHCSLELPVRRQGLPDPAFPIPIAPASESAAGGPDILRRATPDGWTAFNEVWPASGATLEDIGTTVERSGPNVELVMRAGDPAACRWRAWQSVRYLRGDWDCALESEVELTATEASFHLRERLAAKLGGESIFDRVHESDIPRDLM